MQPVDRRLPLPGWPPVVTRGHICRLVAEQPLHLDEIGSTIEQVPGECAPEVVRGQRGEAGFNPATVHRVRDGAVAEVAID